MCAGGALEAGSRLILGIEATMEKIRTDLLDLRPVLCRLVRHLDGIFGS